MFTGRVLVLEVLSPSSRYFLKEFFFGGTTARGGPWPPLQYACKPLDPLLYLSIRLFPSFSGPWIRHPAISFLVFLFVLLHTAFRASFFGIAVSCILSIWPSHRILWHLMNLSMFSPLIITSNSSFRRIRHNSFSFTGFLKRIKYVNSVDSKRQNLIFGTIRVFIYRCIYTQTASVV